MTTPGKMLIAHLAGGNTLGTVFESSKASLRPLGVSVDILKIEETPGQFLATNLLEKIAQADIVIIDISKLNFNLTVAAGYALAEQKVLRVVANASINPPTREIMHLGIFDSLEYSTYENSAELAKILKAACSAQQYQPRTFELDQAAPVYILDTLIKSDPSLRITSKIKKTKIRFRSFDPNEQARLSPTEAYKNVAESVAVIVHLLSSECTGFDANNLRAAFLIGLALGLNSELVVFQSGDGPIPNEYGDFVTSYRTLSDIDERINELAPKIIEALQIRKGKDLHRQLKFLEQVELGDPAAENEMAALDDYYVPTDEYSKTLAGSVRLVVGRKGAGKTALFIQVRNKLRQHKSKVIIDLRPEGYQLKRLKEVVLKSVSEAVQEHVAIAFWEYSLLLEITYKLLEKDKTAHRRDQNLRLRYENLAGIYERAGRAEQEGDFSERLRELTERISTEFEAKYQKDKTLELTVSDVTNLIYKYDINAIRKTLVEYLKDQDAVWILFDNIDKGWPTHGVGVTDVVILRGLLEASRKIQQFFARKDIGVYTVVFLRNDVYELLVDESPDRGKEARVSLDWTDAERLKEILRRRIIHTGLFDEKVDFEEVWSRICVSHIDGNESSEYLISCSLMRPRNLLRLVGYSRSQAINLRHNKIEQEDVIKACKEYSRDIGNEIGLEIRDVFPEATDLLYQFMGCDPILTLSNLRSILAKSNIPITSYSRMFETLLWFSFLGVVRDSSADLEETFIYDVYYDMKKLKILAGNLQNESVLFSVHKAFWPFLEIPMNNRI